MERQPNPEDPAYRDKSTKKKLKKKNTKTPGQQLEESKEYIDSGRGTDSQGNLLMIKRDPKTQQGINRDVKENQTGDQILDPEGNFKKGVYKRPTLEQLKRRAALGIRTTGQVLNAISPSKTTLGLGAGILSLLINNPTRRLRGAI